MSWVIQTVQARLPTVPAWAWVLLTAATVGAVSASVAVMALGRATDQENELMVQSVAEGE